VEVAFGLDDAELLPGLGQRGPGAEERGDVHRWRGAEGADRGVDEPVVAVQRDEVLEAAGVLRGEAVEAESLESGVGSELVAEDLDARGQRRGGGFCCGSSSLTLSLTLCVRTFRVTVT
jgi:hypothetical protein